MEEIADRCDEMSVDIVQRKSINIAEEQKAHTRVEKNGGQQKIPEQWSQYNMRFSTPKQCFPRPTVTTNCFHMDHLIPRSPQNYFGGFLAFRFPHGYVRKHIGVKEGMLLRPKNRAFAHTLRGNGRRETPETEIGS